jgi:hypothetical protein
VRKQQSRQNRFWRIESREDGKGLLSNSRVDSTGLQGNNNANSTGFGINRRAASMGLRVTAKLTALIFGAKNRINSTALQ